MSKSHSTSSNISSEIRDYRHDGTKRKNNPPAGMVSYEVIRETPRQQYAYDPHLSPQLVWADKAGLKNIELEEATSFEVETVSLHIHERISTQAILRAVQKQPKQLELFADSKLPLHEAVEFYQHDMDWTNRLILGDSLLVMNSLLQRELMAGKVQMIYMDPPYGIKFSSNFQPRIDQRDVKDDDESLTREPEQIKAYRDTWTLGVHSYLSYLRDRLILCRELLHESGSIFVQISDENVHRVRCLMDEVFGEENFCCVINFRTMSPLSQKGMANVYDYIVWYA
ncbi:site-specific DNA-methyltransferase [Candidatus Poribacteria bacterium]|nr:site-specific DNA-methyltransferase [Candidatus Poribacteria bacterium]